MVASYWDSLKTHKARVRRRRALSLPPVAWVWGDLESLFHGFTALFVPVGFCLWPCLQVKGSLFTLGVQICMQCFCSTGGNSQDEDLSSFASASVGMIRDCLLALSLSSFLCCCCWGLAAVTESSRWSGLFRPYLASHNSLEFDRRHDGHGGESDIASLWFYQIRVFGLVILDRSLSFGLGQLCV